MKKNLFFTGTLTILISLFLSACSTNEPYVSEPSLRDGVYEGENLTITIDGEPATSIKFVSISSLKIPNAQGIIVGDNGSVGGDRTDVYDTSVIFKGFPGVNGEISLMTVSTLYYFDGKFNVSVNDEVKYYKFSGTFTGDPDSPLSEQGLILEFISIENSSLLEKLD